MAAAAADTDNLIIAETIKRNFASLNFKIFNVDTGAVCVKDRFLSISSNVNFYCSASGISRDELSVQYFMYKNPKLEFMRQVVGA